MLNLIHVWEIPYLWSPWLWRIQLCWMLQTTTTKQQIRNSLETWGEPIAFLLKFVSCALVRVTLGFLTKSSRSLTWFLSIFWHFHISFRALRHRGQGNKNWTDKQMRGEVVQYSRKIKALPLNFYPTVQRSNSMFLRSLHCFPIVRISTKQTGLKM